MKEHLPARHFFTFLSAVLLAAIVFSYPGLKAQNLDLEKSSNGLPAIAEYLNRDSFVEVKAKRLASAQVLWVNVELLQEMGIAVPPEGLNAEFEKKILNAFAYIVPQAGDPESDYLPNEKVFYADRYGGTGVGYAQGSGRAAGAGLFQIKGIGRTDLAAPKEQVLTGGMSLWNPFALIGYIWAKFVIDNHTHGGATLRESMAEAVWGEILQKELPYGANRVVAIIGTKQAVGLAKLPRALIVRQNSLRPAHFIRNDNRPETTIEKDRVKTLIEPFLALPIVAKESKNPSIQLRRVVEVIAERVSRKFGTEYAHGLFHGSSSPSNIELTGRALDHGPMTALDNFTKAINIDDFPNGDIRVALYVYVYQLIDDLRKTVEVKYRSALPTKPEIKELMVEAYNNQIQWELLWRLGLPAEMAKEMVKWKSGRDMADVLLKIGQVGNEELVSTKRRVPFKTGTYDFNRIIRTVADSLQSTEERKSNLSEMIQDEVLVEELMKTRGEFWKRLADKTTQLDFRIENIETYMNLASRQRNQNMPELMRGGLMYLRQYIHMFIWTLTRLSPSVSSYVSTMTSKYSRTYQTISDYDLVLEELKDYKTGSVLRRVYDANSGKTKIEIMGNMTDRQVYFFGNAIKVDQLDNSLGSIVDRRGKVLEIDHLIVIKDKISIQLDDTQKNLSQYKKIRQVLSSGLDHSVVMKLRCEQLHLKAM